MEEMTLDEIKRCEIGILDFIDSTCKENHLQYYLCGGTLLGAIRHKGFIPWDDDIDIMMPRDDYESLFDVWPQFSHYKILRHNNTRNFPYAFGKAIDSRTVKLEPIRKSCQLIGVDVDIFPIDNIPDSEEVALSFFQGIERYQHLLDRHVLPFAKARNLLRTIAYNSFILFRHLTERLGFNSVDTIVSDFSEYAQQYNRQKTTYCGITTISHYGIKEKNLKLNYGKVVNVQFEGKEYPAPIGFSNYLSNLYGSSYMEIPPVEERHTHHSYKAYWRE